MASMVLASCDNGATPTEPAAGAPAELVKLTDDSQISPLTAGAGSSVQLEVKAVDLAGNPIQGQDIQWRLVSPLPSGSNASLTRPSTTTDSKGNAHTSFSGGTVAGSYTVQASAALFSPEEVTPVHYTVEVGPSSASTLIETSESGDGQVHVPGAELLRPFSLQVLDEFGNTVPGQEVFWRVDKGGVLGSETSFTDEEGLAFNTLQFSDSLGVYTIHARLENQDWADAVVLNAQAIRIDLIQSGSGSLSASAGESLSNPLQVRVVEEGTSTPIEGVPVEWDIVSGNATLDASVSSSGADGYASMNLVAGNSLSELVVSASVADETRFFEILVTGPGNVAHFEMAPSASGHWQVGATGSTLPNPLRVQVLDVDRNPVEGITVRWSVVGPDTSDISSNSTGHGYVGSSGSGQGTSVTNADGFASISRTLGTVADTSWVMATLPEYGAEPLFFASIARAPAFFRMAPSQHGNLQEGVAGDPLPNPLRVQVVDEDGYPVPEMEVHWRAEDGEGYIIPSEDGTGSSSTAAITLTDAEGFAVITRVLGNSFGAQYTTAWIEGSTFGQIKFTSYATSANEPADILPQQDTELKGMRGYQLPDVLMVQVVDSVRSPVEGVRVSWAVTEGDGRVTTSTSVTNAEGIASNTFHINTSSSNTVRASLSSISGTVEFDIVGTGEPASIAIVSGDHQSVSGDSAQVESGITFPSPLVVEVRDADGVGVRGAQVEWTAGQGGGSIITTGSSGITNYDGRTAVMREADAYGEVKTTAALQEGFAHVVFTGYVTDGS